MYVYVLEVEVGKILSNTRNNIINSYAYILCVKVQNINDSKKMILHIICLNLS